MTNYLDFGALTRNSNRVAIFVVRMRGPQVTVYTYTSKKIKNTVNAKQFEVYLISKTAESYCVGYVEKPGDAIGEATHRLTNGSIWPLSKLVFDAQTAPA